MRVFLTFLAHKGDRPDPGRLLDNALRHTPAGGTITVGARPRHGLAEGSVTDTGSGIPSKHLPRVFDRF